jgi:hypothetical protein
VWRKSTKCDTGLCVEVAFDRGHFVLVRDGKQPAGAQHLTFNPGAWSAFTAGIKANRFSS